MRRPLAKKLAYSAGRRVNQDRLPGQYPMGAQHQKSGGQALNKNCGR